MALFLPRVIRLGTGVLCCLAFIVGFTHPAAGKNAPPEPASEVRSWTGIEAEQYRVHAGTVGWSDTFVDVVQRYGLDYSSAVQVAEAARSVFDVRDIRADHAYRVYVNPWLGEAQYLLYRVSAAEHVLFDLQNPSETRRVERPVTRRWATVKGPIEGSLYETLTSQNAHPLLALQLSEVFAWQIDFFRLRAGDSLRVLYEQRYIGGEKGAPGDILAAVLTHRGQRYYGIRFDNGDGPAYFNREGESLRRQLLKAPLRYTRISSGYSNSRMHPILNERRPHRGVDYAAPRGTPVRAVGSGTVQFAAYKGANGNYVKVRHNGTYTSGYLHLSSFADGVRAGASVQQGETIGYVGSTGRSTGPHLDYRLWKRGQPVNPYAIELPPSRPVRPQHQAAFERQVQAMMDHLHREPTLADRLQEAAEPMPPAPGDVVATTRR
jgi:murein DD-endopeptidase MepM/ murein hydrolase activator NlpD